MKTTMGLLALFLMVLSGGYYLSTHQTVAPSVTSIPTPAPVTSTSTAASTTRSAPLPPSEPGTSREMYTVTQVATHSKRNSCWTSINGSVYDLTSWIAKHPGGMAAILSLCGKDGTEAFQQQHGTGRDPRPEQVLAAFKIGTLVQ